MGYTTTDDSSRQQALQVLGRTGKLQDLIARAEGQLKNSPTSIQIHQQISEYYQAGRQSREESGIHTQTGGTSTGRRRSAISGGPAVGERRQGGRSGPLLRRRVEKRTGVAGATILGSEPAFRQAQKTDDLIALLDEIDLKQLGNYYSIINLVQELFQNEKSRPQALKLFKKAGPLPAERSYLLSNFYDDAIWKMPEMYDYAREAIIPSAGSAVQNPWAGVDRIMSYSGDGTCTTLLDR